MQTPEEADARGSMQTSRRYEKSCRTETWEVPFLNCFGCPMSMFSGIQPPCASSRVLAPRVLQFSHTLLQVSLSGGFLGEPLWDLSVAYGPKCCDSK